ncbi:MAG TPA: antibiotic biosynthesis monooxygenase [Streptosporangiaceae bacterium]
MSISVLVAFAGVLVAAAGTGLLGGQCVRTPQISFIAWTVGMFALTVALLTQSIGLTTGFAAWSFRLVQLSAQLVAPLMLAWGLVELAARNAAVRFGARLATAALVVVAGVVLATDPLAVRPFARTWPAASVHYQVIPHYALILVHLVVALAAVAVLAACLTSGRRRGAASVAGPRRPAVAAVAGAALALVVLRFSLPGPAYPGLCLLAAGLVWFGMSNVGDLTPVPAQAGSGPGELVVARPPAADDFGPPGFPPVGRAAARQGGADGRPAARGDQRPGGRDRPGPGRLDRDTLDRDTRGWDGPDRPRYQPGAPGAEPATGMFDASMPGLGDLPRPAAPAASGAGADLALPVTPPHGLIAIYTLLEDKVADFDRVADEVAEQVRSGEPDTLVYVIHTVPKAPMQRIFYEVYRDRAAYEQHEKQPYVQRFVTARRPYVLATNVIELRLKYAKISPLPQAEAQAAQAQAARGQAQTRTGAPAGVSAGEGPASLPAVRAGAGRRGRAGRSGSRNDPDRSPAFIPRDPGYPPRDPPGYPPRDPGSRSRDPGYPPRDPGYPPRDPPGYPPRNPGYRGRSRGPASQNRDPGRAPGEPPPPSRSGRI